MAQSLEQILLAHYALQAGYLLALLLAAYVPLLWLLGYSWQLILLKSGEASLIVVQVVRWLVTEGEGWLPLTASLGAWSVTIAISGRHWLMVALFSLVLLGMSLTSQMSVYSPGMAWMVASSGWWLGCLLRLSSEGLSAPLLSVPGCLHAACLSLPMMAIFALARRRLNSLPRVAALPLALGYLQAAHPAMRHKALLLLLQPQHKLGELMRVFVEGGRGGLVSLLLQRAVAELEASLSLLTQLEIEGEEGQKVVETTLPVQAESVKENMPSALQIAKTTAPVQIVPSMVSPLSHLSTRVWRSVCQAWALYATRGDLDRLNLMANLLGCIAEDVHGQLQPQLEAILSILLSLIEGWERLAKLDTPLDGSCQARLHAHLAIKRRMLNALGDLRDYSLRPDLQSRLYPLE